jgi:anti-sigma factor RsiW
MHCAEYRDLVAAHVDGMLTEEERLLALAHLGECAACTRLQAAAQDFQRTFRARVGIQTTPFDVRQRLLARLDAEASAPVWRARPRFGWPRPIYRAAWVGVAAVLVAVVALPFLRSPAPEPSAEVLAAVVADYRAAVAQAAPPAISTDRPEELREYYARSGGFQFAQTVMDLGPMGYQLVGGGVVHLGAKKSTMTVYRSARDVLVCHRVDYPDMQLPAGGELIGGDMFYTVGEVTIRVHREGNMVCFMASTLPREEFIKQMAQHA